MPQHRSVLVTICIAYGAIVVHAGCGGGSSSGANRTLLTGKAFHKVAGGPCCNPPTDTPLAQTLLSFHTLSGTQIAEARTDASGSYSVMLPSGTYAVDLADRANQPFYNAVQPSQIQVTANMPASVDLKFEEDVP